MIYKIYYEGDRKFALPIKNREQLMKLRNAKTNLKNLEKVRQGDEKAKHDLLQLAYNLGRVEGAIAGCKSIGSFFFHDVDYYDDAQTEQIKQHILDRREDIGLVMLERSPRGGWHLVCKRRPGTTILENQVRVSTLLQLEMDTSAKDLQRVVFSTSGSEEDLPFLDDCIFDEPMTEEECREEYAFLKLRKQHGEENVPEGAKKTNKHYRPWEEEMGDGRSKMEDGGCMMEDGRGKMVAHDAAATYNGLLFTDIIKEYWRQFNDGKEPAEGDRNVLTFELAITLRSICDYSLEKMMQVIPNYWNGGTAEEQQEWRKTLENALKEPRKGMPYRLRQVLQALKSASGVKACGGTPTTPPPMPKKLPPLIKLLTKNVPDCYKPAVANTVFPALGAHLHGVKFRYWDNVLHEGTFMNVLIGQQSIGKSSIREPIKYIIADIRKRDEPNRKREDAWKQKNPANKQKKDPRPTDICIQVVIDNLTDAVFNQRIIDANNNGERYIYTSVDEIEALKNVTSKNSVDEVGLLIRKAFDNSDTGQERVGPDSVSGIAPLRWNFNASSTPPNARKFLYKMVNDGTLSRLDISTIIRNDDDKDDPVMGIYDQSYADELKPYLDRLESANGLIECPQAHKLSLEIKEENKEKTALYESEAYRVLSYRANVIAWLKGMVLFVAHGYKWSKEIAEFVRWSQSYNLWCKMLYFGQQLEKELRSEIEIQRQSGPQNLLSLLPDEFTHEQYYQLRKLQGKSGNGDSTLRTWQARGYIAFDEVVNKFCKTEKFKSKYM